MPKQDNFQRAPDDFDPEQTLFFQRRKQRVNLLPLIVGSVLLLGSGALLVWFFGQPTPHPDRTRDTPAANGQGNRADANDTDRAYANAVRAEPVGTIPRATTVPTPAPFDESKPVRSALPVGNVPPGTTLPAGPGTGTENDAPPLPDPNAPLNLDVKDPANAQVRAEVLQRIDLMPGVSAGNKDKLYASVDHARSMGRVLTIPFVKGEMTVRPADVDRLKTQLASPALRGTVDDPTAVFVVLGYADPKGSDKVNADLSLSRARAVLDTLRDRCGVQNVMHAVAMGGSTLFSAKEAEKNRVVEVWAVLP